MDLKNIISKEESTYLILLEEFFIMTWGDTFLPSHDLDHHRRVWKYAKELLEFNKEEFDIILIRKLLIASYLHDIGMSADRGVKHGFHSRRLTEEFLAINKMIISDYRDVLYAIENHDNKAYTNIRGTDQLLICLSAADDLDAFGYTGIYRFAEIYLLRNTKKTQLGHEIIENAGQRFENLRLNFEHQNELLIRHEKRFLDLKQFFTDYNVQVINYNFRSGKFYGCCGVIQIISDIAENHIGIKDVTAYSVKYRADPFVFSFFKRVQEEWQVFP